MSNQNDYSAEEWLTVSSAPIMAGLLVSLSDVSGPIGMAKEALAVVRAVTESASGGANELLTSIAASWKAQVTKPQLPELPRDSPDSARNATIEHCKEAAAIVSQ